MAEIVLARHGQANSEGTDEASYDRLSDLGKQQSRWLGDWLRAAGEPFDRTVDMLISRLRKKLDGASPGSNLITTVRNGGYLFTAAVKQVS